MPNIKILRKRRRMVLPSAEMRRDRAIEADLVDLVGGSTGLGDLGGIRLWVDGGVAHLRGTAENETKRLALRRLIGLVRGVHAVWDLVGTPDRTPAILDVGCGSYKQERRAIGVDRVISGAVSVVAELESRLPFRDDSIDHIFAVHVLEHIRSFVPLMNDFHRILSETGVLHVMVPFWHHPVAVADPTHVRLFVPESFKMFCERNHSINPFRPLLISCSNDTVFADLQPDKQGTGAKDHELVRFFL